MVAAGSLVEFANCQERDHGLRLVGDESVVATRDPRFDGVLGDRRDWPRRRDKRRGESADYGKSTLQTREISRCALLKTSTLVPLATSTKCVARILAPPNSIHDRCGGN